MKQEKRVRSKSKQEGGQSQSQKNERDVAEQSKRIAEDNLENRFRRRGDGVLHELSEAIQFAEGDDDMQGTLLMLRPGVEELIENGRLIARAYMGLAAAAGGEGLPKLELADREPGVRLGARRTKAARVAGEAASDVEREWRLQDLLYQTMQTVRLMDVVTDHFYREAEEEGGAISSGFFQLLQDRSKMLEGALEALRASMAGEKEPAAQPASVTIGEASRCQAAPQGPEGAEAGDAWERVGDKLIELEQEVYNSSAFLRLLSSRLAGNEEYLCLGNGGDLSSGITITSGRQIDSLLAAFKAVHSQFHQEKGAA